jgi:hypothetical protein
MLYGIGKHGSDLRSLARKIDINRPFHLSNLTSTPIHLSDYG